MNVFKPELQAFAVRAILDEAALALGAEEVVQQLATHELVLSDLDDPSAWLSLEFIEALLDGFVKRGGDAAFLERAASNGVTPKSLGSLYPLLFAFGSPAFTYKQLSRLAGRINKTGTWEYQNSRHGSIRTLWIPNPEASQEKKPYLCNFRSVQLVRVPTLFDLPPAVVKHPQCLLRGDSVCAYDISWDEPPSRRHAQVGAVAGGSLAVLLSTLEGTSLWFQLSIAAGFALGGWATGRVMMLRQDLRRRVGDLEEHNQALDRVTRANEQRFAELLEAKAEVDVRVERRTRELSHATQQLSDALDKLQALDRAKTDFFNNVSHELRSPLTLILAPLEELLAGRISPGSERNAYQTMHRNGSRLLRLINQLLDLAKIDAGEMKIAPAPTDLASLVRSAVQTFESVAQKKGVQLQLKHPATMNRVIVDPAWIESAITNLLANALRLTNPGGGVRVDVEDLGAEITVAVSDDGPGIAPADQRRVFERFAQGDSAKRVVGGTGIGLALVREAARLHGGDVELVSELGHGATFKMRLPRRDILATDGEASQISLPPKALLVEEIQDVPQSDDRPGPAPNAPLALVVEDNPELRSFIADVLASRFRVRAAGTGRQGLEMARGLMPEIVVSDVAMPEMDGYDLCRALREDPATTMIPVLLVTARTDVNSILRGFDAGARDYLLKPFHADRTARARRRTCPAAAIDRSTRTPRAPRRVGLVGSLGGSQRSQSAERADIRSTRHSLALRCCAGSIHTRAHGHHAGLRRKNRAYDARPPRPVTHRP